MKWVPEKIRSLRKLYDENQGEFCRRVGVSIDGLQNWEQGRAAPSGSAQLLMDRLEEDVIKGEIRELVGA